MNTEFLLAAILLQAGIKAEVNTFLNDYAVWLIAGILVFGAGIGIAMNFDKIIDRDGQGTRKEGLINLGWIVVYIIIAMAILAAIIALVSSKLQMSV